MYVCMYICMYVYVYIGSPRCAVFKNRRRRRQVAAALQGLHAAVHDVYGTRRRVSIVHRRDMYPWRCCVRACVHARVCARACARACACVCACVYDYARGGARRLLHPPAGVRPFTGATYIPNFHARTHARTQSSHCPWSRGLVSLLYTLSLSPHTHSCLLRWSRGLVCFETTRRSLFLSLSLSLSLYVLYTLSVLSIYIHTLSRPLEALSLAVFLVVGSVLCRAYCMVLGIMCGYNV
jgi:hypothetical protein